MHTYACLSVYVVFIVIYWRAPAKPGLRDNEIIALVGDQAVVHSVGPTALAGRLHQGATKNHVSRERRYGLPTPAADYLLQARGNKAK